jgi:hypothetical protein
MLFFKVSVTSQATYAEETQLSTFHKGETNGINYVICTAPEITRRNSTVSIATD